LRKIDLSDKGTQREVVLQVRNVFRRREFILTLTSDGKKTVVYINGLLVLDAPDFQLSSVDLAARVILGNAARRDQAWAGQIKGLAVYAADLNANEVLQHVREWTGFGYPTTSARQGAVALYLFREPWDRTVPNAVPGEPPLVVPHDFQTIDQLRFESALSERHFDDSYRDDAILNILGFLPLGGVAAWFWSAFFRRRRAALATILTGVTTSFVIEYFQSYLPTRYSGTTDLVTNAIGTCIGAALYLTAAWLLSKRNGLSTWPSPYSQRVSVR
jgi:hypothetical protein